MDHKRARWHLLLLSLGIQLQAAEYRIYPLNEWRPHKIRSMNHIYGSLAEILKTTKISLKLRCRRKIQILAKHSLKLKNMSELLDHNIEDPQIFFFQKKKKKKKWRMEGPQWTQLWILTIVCRFHWSLCLLHPKPLIVHIVGWATSHVSHLLLLAHMWWFSPKTCSPRSLRSTPITGLSIFKDPRGLISKPLSFLSHKLPSQWKFLFVSQSLGIIDWNGKR